MKTLTILTLAALLALGSVTISWGDKPFEIERTMVIQNDNGVLSGFTVIIGDSASSLVVGEINPSYPVFLWLDLQILKTKGIKKLNIYISSGGGGGFSGLSYAAQLIAAWPDFEITTYAMGMVASAAIPIFLAGEYRIALSNTLFMVHKHSLRKPPTIESQSDLRSQTQMMDLIEVNYNDIVTERSNLTLEELIKKTEKTTWFTAQQAKEWGMVEEIR